MSSFNIYRNNKPPGRGLKLQEKKDQRIFCPTCASNELEGKDGIIGSVHPLWVLANPPSSQPQ